MRVMPQQGEVLVSPVTHFIRHRPDNPRTTARRQISPRQAAGSRQLPVPVGSWVAPARRATLAVSHPSRAMTSVAGTEVTTKTGSENSMVQKPRVLGGTPRAPCYPGLNQA